MDHRNVIDALLELAVVPSFSAIGVRLRRRLWGWTDAAPGVLAGRTALVTGATGGLGRVTATALAALGARVLLLGRDPGKLEALRLELAAAAGQDRFPTHVADMSSLGDIRAAGEAIRRAEVRLDVLVDNAGSIYPQRTTSPDGIEASMALMAVGPFALVAELLPLLRASDDARVIAVTSGGMYTQAIDVDDLEAKR